MIFLYRENLFGAFASSNLGDVSPNIMGPKCEFTGLPCDVLTSSCPSGDGACFAVGPGKNQFDSTKIIATRLSNGAIVKLLILFIERKYFICIAVFFFRKC